MISGAEDLPGSEKGAEAYEASGPRRDVQLTPAPPTAHYNEQRRKGIRDQASLGNSFCTLNWPALPAPDQTIPLIAGNYLRLSTPTGDGNEANFNSAFPKKRPQWRFCFRGASGRKEMETYAYETLTPDGRTRLRATKKTYPAKGADQAVVTFGSGARASASTAVAAVALTF